MQPVPKIALVTGAARRAGKTVAETLARAGYAVAVHYRTSAGDARKVVATLNTADQGRSSAEDDRDVKSSAAGGRARAFRADLSRIADIRRLVRAVEERMGPIHLLVNSASVFRPTPVYSVTERNWDGILSANLKSVFFLSVEVARRMARRKAGVIVNIEDAAVARPYRRHAPYLVSKAGVAMLTQVLAIEFGPCIRVAGVAPGPVLLPDHFGAAEKALALRRTILKREGAASDVANAVLFLADQANYTTGTRIFVDGGRAAV